MASGRATSSGWPTCTATTSGSTERSARTPSGAGISPARGRRRPSPDAPTGWGAELYRFANTWCCTSRKAASKPSTRGWTERSTSSTRPRARSSSARSTPPQRNASCGGIDRSMRWRWPNAASTGWPPPRTGSRRCGSVASPCGLPRTWAKPLGQRATAARSTTHVSDSPAWPRGSTSSKRASRVPMAVANWPPTG